jgi:hypothetical protein
MNDVCTCTQAGRWRASGNDLRLLDLPGKCLMNSNHVNGDVPVARGRLTLMRLLVYQACLKAPPGQWRDAMIDRVRAEHDWRSWELTTGHDAMITAPGALTGLLLEIVKTTS